MPCIVNLTRRLSIRQSNFPPFTGNPIIHPSVFSSHLYRQTVDALLAAPLRLKKTRQEMKIRHVKADHLPSQNLHFVARMYAVMWK